MNTLKCKICGGNLQVAQNDTVCTCEYCGTTQTIPLTDSDKKIRLFNRANEYRLNNDFSRAYNAFESIVNEDPKEAEAYWGMVLSEYGVEYVDDPKTGKKIPTCHRTLLKSVLSDPNYLKALELADVENKMIYEDEAMELDKLQKDILNVSSKEKPYDVFISYKENDDMGNRTEDSVLAQDLYDELSEKGLRVFFSRISLEDKFGQNYEPFIFNALRSAKVMLLVTTRNENCNAVWVKNEWSRYLNFARSDSSRTLIPVIKDMSPYELPDELQKLQVLDLNKIGSRQDLIRGVLKLTGHLDKKEQGGNSTNVVSLLKRAKIFLEDGDFKSAEEYFNRILDHDPENGEAYLGKLLSSRKLRSIDGLQDLNTPFDDDSNYLRAIRYLPREISDQLSLAGESVREKTGSSEVADTFKEAVSLLNRGITISDYQKAKELFKSVSFYRNAEELIEECERKISALQPSGGKKADSMSVPQSSVYIGEKKNTFPMLALIILLVLAGLGVLYVTVLSPMLKYNKAKSFYEQKDYVSAYALFEELGDYKDSASLKTDSRYEEAKQLYKNEDYASAYEIFAQLENYRNSLALKQDSRYYEALALFEKQDYEKAYVLFEELDGYKDSLAYIGAIKAANMKDELQDKNVGDIFTFGSYEQDNNLNNGEEPIEWRILAKEGNMLLIISRYALNNLTYHYSRGSLNWGNCYAREWLNDYFYEIAFTDAEKQLIVSSTVRADLNPEQSTYQGSATTDRVFLLSISEAKRYFSSDSDRKCQATPYAYANGTFKANNGNCWWWLRTMGYDSEHGASISIDGAINSIGNDVINDSLAVRPVVWLSLE